MRGRCEVAASARGLRWEDRLSVSFFSSVTPFSRHQAWPEDKMRFFQSAALASLCLAGAEALSKDLRIGIGGRTIHDFKREVRHAHHLVPRQTEAHGMHRQSAVSPSATPQTPRTSTKPTTSPCRSTTSATRASMSRTRAPCSTTDSGSTPPTTSPEAQ